MATKVRRSKSDFIIDTLNCILLGLVALAVLYPLYIVLIASISDPYAVMRGEVALYPKDISFVGYERLLQHKDIWIAYRNTIVYTVVGTALNVMLTMMTGYALSQKFVGRKFVNFYFVFTMFFSGGLIPIFMQMKNYGLYNNQLIFILMGAIGIWNVMIARTFLSTSLPDGLFEAATIDGCSHFRYFFQMVLPLSKALIAVLTVYYAVGHWNDFMTGIIYISNPSYQPLQVVLKSLLTALQVTDQMSQMLSDVQDTELMMRVAESVKYCAIVIATLPILALYMGLQKFFVKGVMIGSLKG